MKEEFYRPSRYRYRVSGGRKIHSGLFLSILDLKSKRPSVCWAEVEHGEIPGEYVKCRLCHFEEVAA